MCYVKATLQSKCREEHCQGLAVVFLTFVEPNSRVRGKIITWRELEIFSGKKVKAGEKETSEKIWGCY